jgi:hypothetical protein
MEIAAAKAMPTYSRYGSSVHKQVYIYGGLDTRPTELRRSYRRRARTRSTRRPAAAWDPSTIAALEARLLALNPSDALLCYNGRHISLAPRSPVVGLIASIYPCILRSIRIDKLYELDDGPAAPHIPA